MGKNYIICLNPFESHFIPTITLAKKILDANHSVSYMGFARMGKIVREEGFQYISLTSCTDKAIDELIKNKSYKELEILYKKLHEEILSKLVDYGADAILMGISRYHLYLIPALFCEAKIYFYSLCGGSPWINKDSPPITSDYIYLSKSCQRIMNLCLWFKRFFRKGINPKIIFARFFYPWTTMRRLCREKKVKWKFGIDGFFPSFPVVTMGTKFLEFSNISGLSFIGLCVNENRVEGSEEYIAPTKPLIYCSLGTMNNRYRKAEAFYAAIIALFKANPQWNLVLSIGSTIKIDRHNLTNNITIYEFAPQLSILKNANLTITHGGYGTVKECIKYAVPMIVLPCSYDQHGNAARVHFHQIGLRNSLLKTSIFEKKFGIDTRNITPEKIKLLIEELISNPKYKANIVKIRQKVEAENELVKGYNKLFL